MVNMLLLAVVGGLILFYVLQANSITSDQYRVQTLNQEAQALSEQHMNLVQQQAQNENSSSLAAFATGNGMIEARGISHIFEAKDVAYQR